MSANQLGFVSQLTDLDTYARDTLGSIRYEVNGVYKYVQYGASRTGQVSGTLLPGDIVCYVLGTTADLDLITLVDEPNSAMGAGAVSAALGASGVSGAGAVAVPTSGGPFFGWIKIRGLVTLNTGPGGSPSAGNSLTTSSASAKTLTKRANEADQNCGTLIDATNYVVALDFQN